MKVALVLFGLVRDVKATASRYSVVRNNYFQGLDVDVFFVTNNIRGNHEWSKGNRVVDEVTTLSPENLDGIMETFGAKDHLIINYNEELKDTASTVAILTKRYPNPVHPIQNTVSKWYKMNRGFQLCKGLGYGVIAFGRVDCKMIPKFSQEQMISSSKLHSLGPLWSGVHSFGDNYIRSEKVVRDLARTHGYPDDFFYGPEDSTSVFEQMSDFLRELTPTIVSQYHPETIFTSFLKAKGIEPELIRWSDHVSESDFICCEPSITNVGHTFPPDMESKWKVRIL